MRCNREEIEAMKTVIEIVVPYLVLFAAFGAVTFITYHGGL